MHAFRPVLDILSILCVLGSHAPRGGGDFLTHIVYHINGVLSFVYVDSVDDKCLSVGLGLVL